MFLNIKHTFLKGGNIYFGMKIPTDLIKKFNSKLIRKSLKTNDPEEIKLLAENLSNKAKNAFTMLRSGLLTKEQEKDLIAQFKAPKKMLPQVKPKLLSNLFSLYFSEHSPNWTEKTRGEFEAQFEVLLEHSGNRPIDDYDRGLCLACRTKLMRHLETATVNKYMSLLSSVFRWGVRHEYAMRNPAEGLMLHADKPADQQRKAYDLEDIKRVLETLPSDEHEIFKYWIPIIAMYSGMRREEICQLYISDIRLIGDVWCFDVNDYADKSVKTESSIRYVPIHSQLIKRGFLEFVENRKNNLTNDRNLWEFVKWKTVWGKKFGNWYSLYYQRKHVTKDPLKCFHSFRHTVADMLKQCGFQEVLIAELLGHANGSITTGRYGKRFLTPKLVDAIESLRMELISRF
jgi:integrase